jgi:hypothetical protein
LPLRRSRQRELMPSEHLRREDLPKLPQRPNRPQSPGTRVLCSHAQYIVIAQKSACPQPDSRVQAPHSILRRFQAASYASDDTAAGGSATHNHIRLPVPPRRQVDATLDHINYDCQKKIEQMQSR